MILDTRRVEMLNVEVGAAMDREPRMLLKPLVPQRNRRRAARTRRWSALYARRAAPSGVAPARSLARTRRRGDNAGMASDDSKAQVQRDEDTLARRHVLGEDRWPWNE